MPTLQVFWDAVRVGHLERSGRRDLSFRYAESWLDTPGARPVSLSLPLQASPFDDAATRPWFANLLPEGAIRMQVARELGVSERNDFALLSRLGGDCAGALQLLHTEPTPLEDRTIPLPWEDLERRIAEAPRPSLQALAAREGALRLSLAGAQDKLPVRYESGSVSLPTGDSASTHLLKVEGGGLPELVRNELYCMNLARAVGLPTPRVEIAPTETPILLVERYDRFRDETGVIRRLHQEDFCQALGLAPEIKYENEGGPSLPQLFGTLAHASRRPLPDRRALLQWVLFNVLIGNADAHAKNLSLLIGRPTGPDTTRLAPFYDLVCTAAYDAVTRKGAQRIGGEYRQAVIERRHWDRLGEAVGIKTAYLHRVGLALCDQVEASMDPVAEAIGGAPEAVLRVLAERTRRLRAALGD